MTEPTKLKPLVSDSFNSPYGDKEVELALLTLARNNGNSRKTVKALGGWPSRQTLLDWRKLHHARYLEMQQESIPHIRAEMAEASADLARKEAKVEKQTLSLLAKKLPEMDGKDLSVTLKNISMSKGINLTHLDKMQGAPAAKADIMDLAEILSRLDRKGVVVDSTAEEIPEAQLAA